MNWIAVAFGGAIGACFRYALAITFAQSGTRFPVATFIANGVGCFLMGVGFILIVEKALLGEFWRHLLLVGLLGAFTTYSTFSVDALSLLQNEFYKTALVYIFGTVALSLASAYTGMLVAKSII